MQIKIPWAKPKFYGKELQYVCDAIRSNWISSGNYLNLFEKKFRERIGAKYGITVSNGTAALQLAIMALGIKNGDEVIVPGYTFAAPVNMVIASGAKPVFADIDPGTWCIDPDEIERKVTLRTKAIIAVHIYGDVCSMDRIMSIAKKRKIKVIEDTAEAVLSQYGGRYAGTFGDMGCFSFQATKNITMGEGGFVATDTKKRENLMRLIREHGMNKSKKYWHKVIGYNFRLTNFQAALGCAQLKMTDKIICDRKRVHDLYLKYLGSEKGLSFQSFDRKVRPVVWAVGIKIDKKEFGRDRDYVARRLAEDGIETRTGFYPFRLMKPYTAPRLPVAEEICRSVICPPMYSEISEYEIKRISRAIIKCRSH